MNPKEDKHGNEAESKQWQEIQDMFDGENRCDERPFRKMLDNFKRDLENHPYVRSRRKGSTAENWTWPRLIRRLTIPVAGAAAAAILISLVLLSSSPLTWADVAQRFAEVDFMYASIYSKQDGLSDAEQIELWMGKGCKVRIRTEDKLIFAEKGKVLASFDLNTRKQTEPHPKDIGLVRFVGTEDTFSLDTIIRNIASDRVRDKVPIRNPNAVISEDLAVFDLEYEEEGRLHWLRFWTLRKSGLPVRIRAWDPRDGASADAFIDYSKPQSETFFDPKAFASALATIKTDQLNLAYLYLKDPGGKIYAPGITDEHEAMSITTTTIDGEPFSLAHYRDKHLLLYIWDRHVRGRRWTFFEKIEQEYGSNENLKIIVVATEKTEANVRKFMKDKNIAVPVLHEPGKGMYNSLARALGVKDAGEVWLITGGKAYSIYVGRDEMVDLACNGLTFENRSWLTQFATMRETTREQLLNLCGKPHETEKTGNRELWRYRFRSADGLYTGTATLRFDEQGRYDGYATSGQLIEPSSVTIEISKGFWQKHIEARLGSENMAEHNEDYHVEIRIGTGKGGGYIIGGGHPRTEIVPERKYSREIPPGTYSIHVRLMNNDGTYTEMKEKDILEQFDVGKTESVGIYFGDSDQPEITRAAYARGQVDYAAKARESLLKKPDYKKMLKDANAQQDVHDDPKYVPWQLHLKEIAAMYENRPLPERMELIPKRTGESYKFKMFPKNLPGHEGYSVVAIVGDLKSQFRHHPLGPGLMRWPETTASVGMNHDFVYRDDTTEAERYTFMLEQMGYELRQITEQRKVFVAAYDGRELPDPGKVSAPKPGGWGWFTAGSLIDTLTRVNNPDMQAAGPVFMDETGLPVEPGPGQDHKDIAITTEMPDVTTQSFETLRPWFKDTFGITFVEETRPMEVIVVAKTKKN